MAIVQEIKELANGVCSKAGLIGGTLAEVKSSLDEANQSLSPFVEDEAGDEQENVQDSGGEEAL